MINIRKLEAELWASADLLRAGSKLTSNQYCMPVLGLIFLRYAYSRFKMVESEILKNRPSRGGRVMPIEASDFAAKSALFLPKEAQYDYQVANCCLAPAYFVTSLCRYFLRDVPIKRLLIRGIWRESRSVPMAKRREIVATVR